MRGLTRWAGYAALNRPLTVLGVERRLFLLGATLAVAVWNATASLMAGGVVFAVCYGAGWLAAGGSGDAGGAPVSTRYPRASIPANGRQAWHLRSSGGVRGEIADELRAYEARARWRRSCLLGLARDGQAA